MKIKLMIVCIGLILLTGCTKENDIKKTQLVNNDNTLPSFLKVSDITFNIETGSVQEWGVSMESTKEDIINQMGSYQESDAPGNARAINFQDKNAIIYIEKSDNKVEQITYRNKDLITVKDISEHYMKPTSTEKDTDRDKYYYLYKFYNYNYWISITSDEPNGVVDTVSLMRKTK